MLLNAARAAQDAYSMPPCRSEIFLMMRCLRDMNMSKFVAEDVPLFLSLIDDLFPGLKADRASFPEISAALEKVSRNAWRSCQQDLLPAQLVCRQDGL